MTADEESRERRRYASRWEIGFVILPGTRTNPGEHLHRPNPDRLAKSMCDRLLKDYPLVPMKGTSLPPVCVRCAVNTNRAKKREVREAESRRKELQKAKDEQEKARREKYHGYQPGSVRTVGGGLPGLGKKR